MEPRDRNAEENGGGGPAPAIRTGVPGRPRKGEAIERRSQLLRTAIVLFLERGYRHVNPALLARESGVAARTIYRSFDNKAALLATVLDDLRLRYMGNEPMLDPAGDIAGVLGKFAYVYMRYLTDPQVIGLRRMILSETGASADLEPIWRDAGPAGMYGVLAHYFADIRIRFHLRPAVPLDLLPSHFMACIVGEHGWLNHATGEAAAGRTMRQLCDARIALFLQSVLLAPPCEATASGGQPLTVGRRS